MYAVGLRCEGFSNTHQYINIEPEWAQGPGPKLRAQTQGPNPGPRAQGPNPGPKLRAQTQGPNLGPRAQGPNPGPGLLLEALVH